MKTRIALLLVILAAIGVAAGCGSSDDNQAAEPAGSGYGASPATTTQAAGQATVSTKTGELGTYLADADGRASTCSRRTPARPAPARAPARRRGRLLDRRPERRRRGRPT